MSRLPQTSDLYYNLPAPEGAAYADTAGIGMFQNLLGEVEVLAADLGEQYGPPPPPDYTPPSAAPYVLQSTMRQALHPGLRRLDS